MDLLVCSLRGHYVVYTGLVLPCMLGTPLHAWYSPACLVLPCVLSPSCVLMRAPRRIWHAACVERSTEGKIVKTKSRQDYLEQELVGLVGSEAAKHEAYPPKKTPK